MVLHQADHNLYIVPRPGSELQQLGFTDLAELALVMRETLDWSISSSATASSYVMQRALIARMISPASWD